MKSSYLQKRFEAAYSLRKERSQGFKDLKPFIGLLKEFANYTAEYGEEVLVYVKRIETDLFNHHLIPFKVKDSTDLHRIDDLPFSDSRTALRYIWYAHRLKEECLKCGVE